MDGVLLIHLTGGKNKHILLLTYLDSREDFKKFLLGCQNKIVFAPLYDEPNFDVIQTLRGTVFNV